MSYAALNKIYGPVVRTGPNNAPLSDSADISVVYDLFLKKILKVSSVNLCRARLI